jgi:hypothetical protein
MKSTGKMISNQVQEKMCYKCIIINVLHVFYVKKKKLESIIVLIRNRMYISVFTSYGTKVLYAFRIIIIKNMHKNCV